MDYRDNPELPQGLIKRLPTVTTGPALTDLSLIGVPEDQQHRIPSISNYPNKFSPLAFDIWISLVDNEDYHRRCIVWHSIDLIWHKTIQEFIGLCQDAGVFPFLGVFNDIARNQFVVEFLRRGRITIVQYLQEVGMFDRVRIRKTFREYRHLDLGLRINSWAELYPIADKNFESWLTQTPLPRMLKHPQKKYTRVLLPRVIVWVRYISSARVILGFTIQTAGQIVLPGKTTPTRHEVNDYLENSIWLPIVRAHRFEQVKNSVVLNQV